MMLRSLVLALVLSSAIGKLTDEERNEQRKWLANPPPDDDEIFKYFSSDEKDDMINFKKVLDKILIPRPPESDGIKAVREAIVKELKDLAWEVEIDSFKDETPIKPSMQFDNIIATLNPNARRRLILSCHYDSKREPSGFLGAMDSAVPCTQLINLAKVLDQELKAILDDKITLQLVFFDGEEALVEWKGNDNTYGSRHLSKRWFDEDLLDGIDIMVLLDLLGMGGPIIRSMDPKTHKWYQRFDQYQKRLDDDPKIFVSKQGEGPSISDDHVSFWVKGVPILHMIDVEFLRSKFWHTMDDNKDNIDFKTVTKLNKMFRVFVAEYLGLKPMSD